MPENTEICLEWRHSVSGGKILDCFENINSELILTKTFFEDFAAGIDYIDGRGVLGFIQNEGYWIHDIDEIISENSFTLQVGGKKIGHRLLHGNSYIDLSAKYSNQTITVVLCGFNNC